MQTLSSASRTCMAALSAVECTATVLIPISRQARWMRSAISPRLAMRTFSNIAWATWLLDDHQHLAVFDGRAVGDQDLGDPARLRRADLVHHLHRLDDEQHTAFLDAVAELDEGRLIRLRRDIGGADHRRLHGARMIHGATAAAGGSAMGADVVAATLSVGASAAAVRATRMRRSPTEYSISVNPVSSRSAASVRTSSLSIGRSLRLGMRLAPPSVRFVGGRFKDPRHGVERQQ